MALVLEIEHLLGVAFSARGAESAEPEWPPQPDRVFSALVAAWGARGCKADERAALAWLETQPTPVIEASEAWTRPAPSSFVPPNDFETPQTLNVKWFSDFIARGVQPPDTGGHKAQWQRALSVMPQHRTRKERRFPAALPQDPTVRLVWGEAKPAAHAEALEALARDVTYVGHSASLTRCRFLDAERGAGDGVRTARPARRRIYRGRLEELETAFGARRRPTPGDAVVPPRPAKAAAPVAANWIVLEIVDAVAKTKPEPEQTAAEKKTERLGGLDLRAAPMACKALIKTVMAGYERRGLGGAIPAWVSGHEADGRPTTAPHLAAAPLAFVGFPHADGDLMGLALIPPPGTTMAEVTAVRRALAACEVVQPGDDGEAERRIVLTLRMAGASVDLHLRVTAAPGARSLRPERYLRAATTWATATPLVLDRHVKGEDREAITALIAEACERATGLRPTAVSFGKHAAVTGAPGARPGAPGARPGARAPGWMAWRVPEALASRRLVHAVVQFDRPVTGPVMLGAGRFCGLGLCLPLDPKDDA